MLKSGFPAAVAAGLPYWASDIPATISNTTANTNARRIDTPPLLESLACRPRWGGRILLRPPLQRKKNRRRAKDDYEDELCALGAEQQRRAELAGVVRAE